MKRYMAALLVVLCVPLLIFTAYAEEGSGNAGSNDPVPDSSLDAGLSDGGEPAAGNVEAWEDPEGTTEDPPMAPWYSAPPLGSSGFWDDGGDSGITYPAGELGLLMEIRDLLSVFMTLAVFGISVLIARFIIKGSLGIFTHFS